MLHWNICKKAQISVNEKWYNYTPEDVTENEKVKILWDFSISTDRSLKANRPDIIFMDKNAIECLLIYVAVPADIYVSVKEFL